MTYDPDPHTGIDLSTHPPTPPHTHLHTHTQQHAHTHKHTVHPPFGPHAHGPHAHGPTHIPDPRVQLGHTHTRHGACTNTVPLIHTRYTHMLTAHTSSLCSKVACSTSKAAWQPDRTVQPHTYPTCLPTQSTHTRYTFTQPIPPRQSLVPVQHKHTQGHSLLHLPHTTTGFMHMLNLHILLSHTAPPVSPLPPLTPLAHAQLSGPHTCVTRIRQSDTPPGMHCCPARTVCRCAYPPCPIMQRTSYSRPPHTRQAHLAARPNISARRTSLPDHNRWVYTSA